MLPIDILHSTTTPCMMPCLVARPCASPCMLTRDGSGPLAVPVATYFWFLRSACHAFEYLSQGSGLVRPDLYVCTTSQHEQHPGA